jgi:hypothetical protein
MQSFIPIQSKPKAIKASTIERPQQTIKSQIPSPASSATTMSNSKSAPTVANSNGGQQRQQHQQECCSAAAFAQSQCFCKTNGQQQQQQQQQPHNQQQQQRNGPVGHRPRQPTATVSLNSMQASEGIYLRKSEGI